MTKDDKKGFFQLSGYALAMYILPLPLLGFISCVILSVIYDFERSTATHCGVKNYLPSISSAIGGFTPQRYIWRLCIALHSTPRVMIAIMLHNYYKRLVTQNRQGLYDLLVRAAFVIHLAEIAALMMLTNVSSSENYSIHEMSFIMFMVCSLVYMLLTCIIMKWGHALTGMSSKVSKCYRFERNFFVANFSSFMFAIYFFYRHNAYCETGVYTLFALMEYITVTTNILFHGSAVILFGQVYSWFAMAEYLVVITNIGFHGAALFTQFSSTQLLIYQPHEANGSYV